MTHQNEILGSETLAVLLVLLAVAVVSDLKSHRIPNLLLAPTLSLALMMWTMLGGFDGLVFSLSGLALGLAMLLPLYLVRGTAAGDVKLLGVVGSFLGPWGAVVAGLSTMMAGAVIGIIFVVWQSVRPSIELQATRFLTPPYTGARSSSGTHSLGRRSAVTRIPYAPAIAGGTLIALWYTGMLPSPILELTL